MRPTELAQRAVGEIYGPVVTEGNAFLARFDDAVLTGMIELLEFATRQHREHAETLTQP
ncbi:hypothetical protein AB0M46_22320 [Dactylosporangium sp. NPDC051485]|uniref:hypothetical protein n=1 Tax=Dactylosporangium sp. NPDC051485 TaxID=3154846 RepID=UPI00343C60B8